MTQELGIGSYAYRWAIGVGDRRPREPLRLIEMVEDVARLGCTLLQIADNTELEEADDDDLHRLRVAAEQLGIRLQTGFSGADPARLRDHLRIATALGADVVRVVLHGADGKAQDIEHTLRDALDDYADSGVRLGIENHFLSTSPEILALLDRVGHPALGVIVDVGNSIVCGEWPERTLELLAPHAVGLHLKDYDFVPDDAGVGGHLIGARLGEGRTDIAAVLDAMPATESRFGVVYEQWSPWSGNIDETITMEREWREHAVRVAQAHLPAAVAPR